MCVSVWEKPVRAPPALPSFLPLLHSPVPWEGGEVMYGPAPDRATQQSRWTKRDRRTEVCTVVRRTKGMHGAGGGGERAERQRVARCTFLMEKPAKADRLAQPTNTYLQNKPKRCRSFHHFI